MLKPSNPALRKLPRPARKPRKLTKPAHNTVTSGAKGAGNTVTSDAKRAESTVTSGAKRAENTVTMGAQ